MRDEKKVDAKQRPPMFYWFFTWNNWVEAERCLLHRILEKECEWFVYQEEKGESQTTHLQGTIKLKSKKRLTALKKWHSAIHWEETKHVVSSIEYCSKEETRNGKQWLYGIDVPQPIKVHEPRGWQLSVMDILNQEPDDRTIHWFWEPNGNVGKSQLCKYLVVKRDAVMLTGKSNDMFHQLSKLKNPVLVLVDVPRTSVEYINYGAIEQIKNGLIFSGKYEGAQLVFNSPHVIVFANIPPDYSAMSADRWKVYDISSML